METKTKTSPPVRELSKTEATIAAAQIYDRAVRCIKASEELGRLSRKGNDSDSAVEALFERYSIPDDMRQTIIKMMFEHMDKRYLPSLKKIIGWWVAGSLTEEECQYAMEYMSGVDELDYGFVFLDQPMHYFQEGQKEHQQALDKEFITIGSRNRKKHPGKPITEGVLKF